MTPFLHIASQLETEHSPVTYQTRSQLIKGLGNTLIIAGSHRICSAAVWELWLEILHDWGVAKLFLRLETLPVGTLKMFYNELLLFLHLILNMENGFCFNTNFAMSGYWQLMLNLHISRTFDWSGESKSRLVILCYQAWEVSQEWLIIHSSLLLLLRNY